MATAYLGFGSNLGDRDLFIKRAIDKIRSSGVVVVKQSAIIDTAAVGGPPQGNYLNLVLKVRTDLSLEDLFVLTSSVEHQLGRLRKIINGPRVIDIDILLYDDVKLVSKDIIVPHPRMFERDFVMRPLQEIEPALCASFTL